MPDVSIDHEAGAAYVALREAAVAHTRDHGGFIADYDEDGRVVGLEVLTLERLPDLGAILALFPDEEDRIRKGMEELAEQVQESVAPGRESGRRIRRPHAEHSSTAGVTRSKRPLEEVRFLTIGDVATILRVTKMTVYRMVHSGVIPAIRVGRSYRVPEQAVHDYLHAADARLEQSRRQ